MRYKLEILHQSVKRVKTKKSERFGGDNSYVCRSYRGKTGRETFCPPPPPLPTPPSPSWIGLTSSSLYQAKILVLSSNFIMDLVSISFIFVSLEVYLQILNLWNLTNFQCMQWFKIRIQNIFIQMLLRLKLKCSYIRLRFNF